MLQMLQSYAHFAAASRIVFFMLQRAARRCAANAAAVALRAADAYFGRIAIGSNRAMPAPKRKSEKLVQDILARIASGQTLSRACKANGITPVAFMNWREESEALSSAYARAVEMQHDAIAEHCLDIADTEPEIIHDAGGNARRDSAFVSWQKARIETRLKLLSKWSPRYSDAARLELTGKNGGAIQVDNSQAVTELVNLLRNNKRQAALPAPPIQLEADKPSD